MGLAPVIKKERKFQLKTCNVCGNTFGPEGFAPTKSIFYPDGCIPMCNQCIDKYIESDETWNCIDKLCQMANIPFIPSEWTKIREMNSINAFYHYAEVFLDSEYDSIDWTDYYEQYKRLRAAGRLEDELPAVSEEHRHEQRMRWGSNYDDEGLDYLDSLYNGLMNTQNVNGALQVDQALKICKISYEIDQRISEGSDFDKLLASYDKLVKTAEFTPKNVKNLNDFDTCGELVKWLEKRGWHNKFYDNVTRDIVDETMKNIQAFNQRLYTNESGIGDDITHRIENLRNVKQLENYYDTDISFDKDEYENKGYETLFNDLESEEFSAGDDNE